MNYSLLLVVGVIALSSSVLTHANPIYAPGADYDPAARDATEKFPVGYGVMLDAGSTGSRVHVYRWLWDGGSLPNVTDDFFYEIKPGVSSFKDDPSHAGDSIQPLLDYAISKMPKERVGETWARLYATAGLRLLRTDVQEGLLEALRFTLTASPFKFDREWVAIASGVDEAVDAWVTANYILGGATAESYKESVGTLDLGGASIQITTRTGGDIPEAHKYSLSLGDKDIPLYAHSHLAYGLQQMRKRVDLLVKGSAEKVHPCLHKGSSVEINGEEYHGASDFQGCMKLQQTMGEVCDIHLEECAPMSSIPPPSNDGLFLAFSYFWDVLTEFMPTLEPTVHEIRARAEEVCKMEAEEVKTQHGETYEPKNPEFVRRACQDMTYILHLLHHHLQFQEHVPRIRLVKQIEGKEMSWTLGASLRMLHGPPPSSTTADKVEL